MVPGRCGPVHDNGGSTGALHGIARRRPVRKAGKAANGKVRVYAAAAMRETNVLAMMKSSMSVVRAAKGKNDGEYKWYCTPEAVVRTDAEVDVELTDDEIEVSWTAAGDDDREAALFADYTDDGDDDYASPASEAVPIAPEGVQIGVEHEVDRDGFVYLCGEATAVWLEVRVLDADDGTVYLKSDDARRWGLTEARDIEWHGEERAETQNGKVVDMMAPADRVLFWDGEDGDVEFPRGLDRDSLITNCFYASTFDDLR